VVVEILEELYRFRGRLQVLLHDDLLVLGGKLGYSCGHVIGAGSDEALSVDWGY